MPQAEFPGIDPIEARKAERQQARLDAAKGMTFRACAERYIVAHKAGWRNPKQSSRRFGEPAPDCFWTCKR